MTTRKNSILSYQQKCYHEYAQNIGLPEPYIYPDGNPIRPLPPVQTAVGWLMIVGAYPSARFESRPSRIPPHRPRLVPVADNLQPFGYEKYFDGQRVHTLESADGLQKYLLAGLSLSFKQCWITDIVKVFLYKPEHVASCGAVHPEFKVPDLRSRFRDFAQKSLPWLQEECRLCEPKLIVTLGEEVAQVVSGELSASADKLLSRDVTRSTVLGNYPTLFLPHPDACRRSEKWRARISERIEAIRNIMFEAQ